MPVVWALRGAADADAVVPVEFVSFCKNKVPFGLVTVTDQDKPKPSCRKSQSVTSRRQNWVFLLQIEMFEAVSLRAEPGALVVALEVGGVHSWGARYAIVSKRAGNTTGRRCS